MTKSGATIMEKQSNVSSVHLEKIPYVRWSIPQQNKDYCEKY
jgi:hypothetical protein